MIFITGATGFIGSKVLDKLLEKNEKICILSRRRLDFTKNVEVVNANLTNIEKYKEQLKKTQVLIHIAGCARAFSQDASEFYQTNFFATRSLIAQALEYGIEKIIYISTCMVFGPSDKELSEDDYRERSNFFTDYEKSKYLAEKVVRSKIKEGAPIIILYPTRVFGPGKFTQCNSLTKLFLFFIKFKYFPVIENPSCIGNYVYVNDVVNVIIDAVYKIKPPETFLVGGYNLSFYELFQTLNKVCNMNGKIIVIKKYLANLIAKTFEEIEVNTGIPALISRGWVSTFATNWLFSNKKIKTLLNYNFIELETALKNTIEWLKVSYI